jgi:hypothetical protein
VSIQIQGYSGTVTGGDGPTYKTMRVTVRPVDYGSLGQYRCLMRSNPIMAAGLGSGADVFQARWVSTPQLAILWGLSLDMWCSTGFSAGFANFTLTVARSWTVDGSGGAAADLTGNNQKLRTNMASSAMGAIRISNGSSLLTTGTRTLDSSPEGQAVFSVGTSSFTTYITQASLYGAMSLESGGNPAPIVLAQNEGVVVRATVPATGTWGHGVTMAWSEVAAY